VFKQRLTSRLRVAVGIAALALAATAVAGATLASAGSEPPQPKLGDDYAKQLGLVFETVPVADCEVFIRTTDQGGYCLDSLPGTTVDKFIAGKRIFGVEPTQTDIRIWEIQVELLNKDLSQSQQDELLAEEESLVALKEGASPSPDLATPAGG